jgi:hypothetical protein
MVGEMVSHGPTGWLIIGGGVIMVSTVAHLRDLLDSVAVCSSAGSSFSWRLTLAPKL